MDEKILADSKRIIVCVVSNKDRYLLLKRQKDKKYDPERWEFISGFIQNENDLEKQALDQIRHETELVANFIKQGTTFKVRDEYGTWLITPFLFFSNSEKVKLRKADHTEYQWIKPQELDNFNCVKDLKKNLDNLGIA